MRDNQSTITHEGNMGTGRTTKMSLDLESLPHLSKVLTNLYTDKAGAIIREYSTNAWDSHVEAGKTDVPIEIELPRSHNPVFIVRDRGTGLSEDEVHGLYTMYGKSTKRGSDEVIGMLGLGCKSALTYTKQFTMVCVKDGMLTTARIYVGDDGAGEVETVEELSGPTDEPNGVEVQIPVEHDHDIFKAKVMKFFSFWDAGSVLIDGEPNESILDGEDVIALDPDVYLVPRTAFTVHDEWKSRGGVRVRHTVDQDYLVMGGVAYPTPAYGKQCIRPNFVKQDYRVVARVPIGSLNFTPNRESVEDTKLTTETCQQVSYFVATRLNQMVKDDLDKCEKPTDAFAARNKWYPIWSGGFYYRGQQVPTEFYLKFDRKINGVGNAEECSFLYHVKGNTATSQVYSIALGKPDKVVIVVGHTNKGVPYRNKQKIKQHLEDTGHEDAKWVYLLPDRPSSPWLESIPVLQWDDISAIKLPTTAKHPGGRTSTKKDTWAKVDPARLNQTTAVEKPTCKRPVYWSPTEDISTHSVNEILTKASAEAFIVPKNRWARFEREYNGVHIKDFIQERAPEFIKRLTPGQSYALTADRSFWNSGWALLDPKEVDDPDLRAFVEAMQEGNNKLSAKLSNLKHIWRQADVAKPFPDIKAGKDARDQFARLEKRYLLLSQIERYSSRMFRKMTTEVHEYVNAVHQYRSQPDTKEDAA